MWKGEKQRHSASARGIKTTQMKIQCKGILPENRIMEKTIEHKGRTYGIMNDKIYKKSIKDIKVKGTEDDYEMVEAWYEVKGWEMVSARKLLTGD